MSAAIDREILTPALRSDPYFTGGIFPDAPLAPRTTIRIGGTAALLVEPDTVTALEACVRVLRALEAPFFILGGGSNIVFPDGPLDRVVVSVSALSAISLESAANTAVPYGSMPDKAITNGTAADGAAPGAMVLHCGAGCPTDEAADFCLAHNLAGLESFTAIPGTIGGAVYMNARCYDHQISDVLEWVDHFPGVGGGGGSPNPLPRPWAPLRLCVGNPSGHSGWSYKKSPFQPSGSCGGDVILGAAFRVRVGADPERAAWCRADREARGHFRLPSAGSVFKNSRLAGKPSGQLVDQAGLKGAVSGGAQIAPWHGNIIVNTGGATAADVRALVALAKEAVRKNTGVTLEEEIVFV
ncbi:MAG: FAD-binding protein [Spirochaetaceae bacterium]|jgi:UDP-N-acetylmuramate dehydrogenase|nr:FAD-binding protein [Spirochaetaceae bacterium]